MSQNPVFQLSALSQNDQPNSECPGCSEGDNISAVVIAYDGCELLTPPPPPPYPASNVPVGEWVHLPIPKSKEPTPTWFFEVTNGIENVWVDLVVFTPYYGATEITVQGSNLPAWVAQIKKNPTNQIYKRGNCGIFGYAQDNVAELTYWIYTVTAGVCNPMLHPPG